MMPKGGQFRSRMCFVVVQVPQERHADPAPIPHHLERADDVLALLLFGVVGRHTRSRGRAAGGGPTELRRPQALVAVAVLHHDVAVLLHRVAEIERRITDVRRPAIVPGLPVLQAHVGRIAVAAGMDADRVAVVLQARPVHLLQVGRVPDRAAGRVAPVGVGAPLTTIMLGQAALIAPIGRAQQSDVSARHPASRCPTRSAGSARSRPRWPARGRSSAPANSPTKLA